jgi:hypothetical protein
MDETSLMIKNPHRPAVVWKRGMCHPAYSPQDTIFSFTTIFIVSTDGKHCPSTLILNRKAEMKHLADFICTDVDVRFIYR